MGRRLGGLLVAGAVLVGCAANTVESAADESSEPTTATSSTAANPSTTNPTSSLTTVDSDTSDSEPDVDQVPDEATLDDIEELRQAIEIEDYPPAQNPCFVDSIVDTLGVARLAEIGVTVETPEYLGQEYRLTEDEHKAIVAARQSTCDLTEEWASRWIHFPELLDCTVRQLSTEEFEALVQYDPGELRGEAAVFRERAELACADEVIAANFVRPAEVSAVVSEHASELVDSVYFVQGRFEERCFVAGIESEVSVDLLDPHLRWVNGGFNDSLDLDTARQLWRYQAVVEEVANICLSPLARLDQMLFEARAAGNLHQCLFHELDHEQLKETMAARGPALWEGDPGAASTLFAGLNEVGQTVEFCDEDGRYAQRWRDYVQALEDNGFG